MSFKKLPKIEVRVGEKLICRGHLMPEDWRSGFKDRAKDGQTPCDICGRGTHMAYQLEMIIHPDTHCMVIVIQDEHSKNLCERCDEAGVEYFGCHAIGSTCRRKMPKNVVIERQGG